MIKHKFTSKVVTLNCYCKKKHKSVGNTIKAWLIKHNRTLAITFALLVFSLMLGIVFTCMLTEKPSAIGTSINKEIVVKKHANLKPEKFGSCEITKNYETTITCNAAQLTTIKDYLNSFDDSFSNLAVIISGTTFENGIITKGWLSAVEGQNVRKLEMKNCWFENIEEGAFSGTPFTYLNYFTLVTNRPLQLKQEIFYGMQLTNLEIRADFDGFEVEVEKNALKHLSNTLAVFQMQRLLASVEQVNNLFGPGNIFTKLLIIDLRDGRIDQIQADTFAGAVSLVGLTLDNNVINSIDVNAFKGKKLTLLSLSTNHLTKLPNGVFDFIHVINEPTSDAGFNLEKNQLVCDCSLEWLKDVYLKYPDYFKAPPYCYNDKIDITEKQFNCCPTATTTTTTESPVTFETTTLSTTEYPLPLLKMTCPIPPEYPEEANKELIGTQISVQGKSLELSFYELDIEPFMIKIEIEGNVSNIHLIWFNSKDTNEMGCIQQLKNDNAVDKLNRGQTYTLCLMRGTYPSVSPFDCFGLSVPKVWNERALFLNEDLPDIIGISSGALICAIFLTGIIVFFCIRQNPQLIKGNKKVIIVKNIKQNETIVLPEQYDKPIYVPRSIASTANLTIAETSGYITPRHHKYSRVKYRPAYSNYSTIRSNPSYAETFPSLPEMWGIHPLTSRKEALEDIRSVDGFEDDEVPPLPPPNGLGKDKQYNIYTIG